MAISDPIIGGIISGIGSVGSALLSGSSAKDRQREMLEYNSPVNQRKRLLAAGINPGLAMSNGMMDSGNASQAAPPTPQFDLNTLAQGIRDSQALRLQERETNADVGLKEANAEAQRIRNKTQLMRDLTELMNMRADLASKGKNIDFLDKQIAFRQKEIDWYDRKSNVDILKADAETRSLNANAAYQEIINGFEPQKQALLLKQIHANISSLLAAANEHNSAAVRNKAEALVAKARKQGLDIENDQADALVDVIYNKALADADKSFYDAGNAWKQYEGGKVGSLMPGPDVRQKYGATSPNISTDWQVVPRKHRK